ncbi:Glutathione-dependent formaldehyde-activating enzyme/centromere protein V [Penicillium longicatenatum]|uniref:Glutathione-dependent formaldehyde-activating enzyme/centromere protein V n=1 Tax=Penicillium longicatenatum TaxID=1561947 RepID=UPI0025498127|nr:Glutathione-dependent formaldehyde-activating enzyme/centromere protein V [Penicillium longicatenatum]KAJ5639328.1 Glutathione-dependent formaldehyde-activating enzyme/centromere protein V [Penicillium longicatenatum]KAJ5651994.1 Glutathione-dependent formaldehyde-activating enzyme/centromere protein V [Penicillium longicatenatum]
MTLTGSCMCGAIHYTAEVDKYLAALCHCTDCQKWSGGAFTSNAVVPRNSLKVTKGTPTSYDAIGNSGKINKHFFCPTCGSSLYTELEVMPDMTCVKAGGLDNKEAHMNGKVDIEFYVKDRPSYLAAVEGAKQEPMFG